MSQTRNLNFGGMSIGVFGSSMPASGASSSPAVGASLFTFDDSLVGWLNPASGGFGSTTQSSPFGSSFQQQSQPAFGASSTPAFGASSTSAFGSTSKPAFGTSVNGSSTPAFGASITPPSAASSTPAFGVSSTPASGASSTPPLAGSSSVWSKPSSGGGFGSTTQSSPFGSSFQQQSQPDFSASSTPAFGASSTPAFGATSTSAFGASSSPSFGAPNTPAFGTSVIGSSTPAFGASSSLSFGAPSTPALGASSTPAFGNTGSAFGTPVFGSSTLDFDASSTPAFGAPSTPAFSATSTSAFGATSTPAFGNTGSAFGTSVFGSSTPDFGVASTPAFGASSVPTYGQSQPAFGASGTPAFGASSTTAFGAISTSAFGTSSMPVFGNTGSAFGSRTLDFGVSSAPAYGQPTFAFGCSPFGAIHFPFGPQTSAPSFWSHGFGQPSFRGQLREGTRVTTYAQTTDNCDYSVFPPGKLKSISAMPTYKQKSQEELRWEDYKLGDNGDALFHYPPVFWNVALGSSAFFVAFGSTSKFRSAAFGCPYCRPNSYAFGPSTPIFGTRAQGTTSLFGTGFNNGSTQSSSLFQSPTPTLGQTSFPFGGEPSSMEVDQKTPFQSTRPIQTTGGFCTSTIFGQDVSAQPYCGQSQTSSIFVQDLSRHPFHSQSPTSSNFGQVIFQRPFGGQSSTLSQQSDKSPFGTLPTMPVDDKPSAMMKSCLLNTLQQIAQKYPDIKFTFSNAKETTSTTPAFGQIPFGGQKRAGTRVTLYAMTSEEDGGKLIMSISAMCAYNEKSHEELRWEDYQLGYKVYIHCDFNMNNTQQ